MPSNGHSKRRTVSYNLTNAWNREAFEAEMDYEDSERAAGSMGSGSLRSRGSNFGGRVSGSFNHHEESAMSRTVGPPLTPQQESDLISLRELFPHTDEALIRDVYTECNRSMELAMESLFMLVAEAPAAPISAMSHPLEPASLEPCSQLEESYWDGCWVELPEDVRNIILGCIGPRDMARVAWTCRDFASRVMHRRINARAIAIPAGLSLSGMVGMVAGHPNAHTINLTRWGSSQEHMSDTSFRAVLSSISQGSCSRRRNVPVQSLCLRGISWLTDGHIASVCSTMQHLMELDLSNCGGLTDACLVTLAKYQRSSTLHPSIARPPATGSSLGSADGALDAGVTTSMAALCVTGVDSAQACDLLGEASAHAVSAGWRLGGSSAPTAPQGRGLRNVVVAGTALSTDGVKAFLAAAAVKESLEGLDVSRCNRLTRAALMLPPTGNLRVLRASQCNNLHEVIIQLPSSYPLRDLYLDNCKAIKKVQIVAPSLRTLHIGGSKSLMHVSLRCPALEQLMANLCFSLAIVEPEQVLCPNLKSLNLYGARHLETASLAAFLGQAQNLRSLDLNGCNSISALELHDHPQLAMCDVSACKGLTSLRLLCPQMEEVYSKSCPRLQDVGVESDVLKVLEVSHCRQLRSIICPALRPPQQYVATDAAPRVVLDKDLPKIIIYGSDRHLPPQLLADILSVKSRRSAARKASAVVQ